MQLSPTPCLTSHLVGALRRVRSMRVQICHCTKSCPLPLCCACCLQRNNLQDSTQALALEWGQPLPAALQPPYDLVLCSDLVYSPASVQPLLSTISAVAGPDSLVLYACEFREGAGLELFHQLLPQHHLKEQLVGRPGCCSRAHYLQKERESVCVCVFCGAGSCNVHAASVWPPNRTWSSSGRSLPVQHAPMAPARALGAYSASQLNLHALSCVCMHALLAAALHRVA